MPRNTNKKGSNRTGQSSSQPTGGFSSQPEGYVPAFDPNYWVSQQNFWASQQSLMSPMQQTPLFQNMGAFGTQQQPSPPFQPFQQFPQSPLFSPFQPQHSPQFQPPLSQQFQSQQSQQPPQSPQFRPYDSDEAVPDSEPEYDHQDDHVYDNDDEDEEEVAGEGGSRGKGKAPRKAWNHREETLLGKAWCDISQDARYGNDQTSKRFWQRVTKRFNAELNKGPDYRTHHQCNTKFNNMNRDIQKYNGIFTHYWNQPRYSIMWFSQYTYVHRAMAGGIIIIYEFKR